MCRESERSSIWYHFSIYSTPSESLTDRFCRLVTEKFGSIPDITDMKVSYTNFSTTMFVKLTIVWKSWRKKVYPEAGASGGFIHTEYPKPFFQQNLRPSKLFRFLKFGDRVGYLGTNTPIDRCYKCDFWRGFWTNLKEDLLCLKLQNSDPKTVDARSNVRGYLEIFASWWLTDVKWNAARANTWTVSTGLKNSRTWSNKLETGVWKCTMDDKWTRTSDPFTRSTQQSGKRIFCFNSENSF